MSLKKVFDVSCLIGPIGLFEMIGAKEGSRFKVVHATTALISERVTAQL